MEFSSKDIMFDYHMQGTCGMKMVKQKQRVDQNDIVKFN